MGYSMSQPTATHLEDARLDPKRQHGARPRGRRQHAAGLGVGGDGAVPGPFGGEGEADRLLGYARGHPKGQHLARGRVGVRGRGRIGLGLGVGVGLALELGLGLGLE